MALSAPRRPAPLALTDDELAYFRVVCELFPLVESPLRALADSGREPQDLAATHAALAARALLRDDGIGAAPDLAARLAAVSECAGRVGVTVHGGRAATRRDFYLSGGAAVEYSHAEGSHRFGPVLDEAALVGELARALPARQTTATGRLELSAGDYLVFAVFARDVRSAPAAGGPGPDAPMSVAEVLAYFDEPETPVARTPDDESWERSVQALAARGVIVARQGGWELHGSYHALARELAADHQQTIARIDFFDEHWFTRELHLFPAADTVYRLGTQPDGAVVVEELSAAALHQKLAAVVRELPPLRRDDGARA